MDLTAALSVINSLSVDERIRLVEAVWDGIAAEQPVPQLTDAKKNELDRRLADHRAAPDDVIPWETVKQSAVARGQNQ
jgi:putative addiction module component (TIGR02574 family)